MVSLTPLEKFWARQPRWVRALVLALIGFGFEFASDAIAHATDGKWPIVHLSEDFGFSLIWFGLGFWLASFQDRSVKRKTQMLAYLNHHCRNAMQIIRWANTVVTDRSIQNQMISDSVDRVIDTLNFISKEENFENGGLEWLK